MTEQQIKAIASQSAIYVQIFWIATTLGAGLGASVMFLIMSR